MNFICQKSTKVCFFGTTTIGGHSREKSFLGITPLGVRSCDESKSDIFEAKKRFLDSGKAYCVLKRKMKFLPKNDIYSPYILTPFGVKICGKSEFDIYKIPRIQEKLYIDAKLRENHLLIGLNHWLTKILQKV